MEIDDKEIEVYKIETLEGKPLYCKTDKVQEAFDYLSIGFLPTDLIIKKMKMKQYEFDMLPEHSGF